VTELASAGLAADGGQPFTASPGFLRRCYLSGAEAHGGFAGERLVCVSGVRRVPPEDPGGPGVVVTTGVVHPDFRRRGIGGYAFDRVADQAGDDEVRAETEALGDCAHALYLRRGLSQVFAENVMQLGAAVPLPPVRAPGGLSLATWGAADPARFHAVYAAAFRDRPGYPGWTRERWIEWISEDDDFRAQWTLLAALDGADVAFIVGEAGGWVAQMGVVPAARGRDIGAALLAAAVRRMRDGGQEVSTLNVNVDNPHAAALYRRMGFIRTGRRARYQRPGCG
jgi:mycothiol synthase